MSRIKNSFQPKPIKEPGREPGQDVKALGRGECGCGCSAKNSAQVFQAAYAEISG
jgi:hypothetical protein